MVTSVEVPPGAALSRMAVAGFVLGVSAVGAGVLAVALDVPVLMPLMLVSVVLALVLGIAARRRVRRGGGRVRGSGLADWAIVLGSLGLLLALILPMT